MVKAGCSQMCWSIAPTSKSLLYSRSWHDGIESLILAFRRPFQASLEQSLFHQADVRRLGHFKNYLWHDVVVNILFIRTCPVLAAIHSMNQPLKGKTFAVAHRHVLSTLGFPWGFWWFCGALALGKFYSLPSGPILFKFSAKCSLINLLSDKLNYNDKL